VKKVAHRKTAPLLYKKKPTIAAMTNGYWGKFRQISHYSSVIRHLSRNTRKAVGQQKTYLWENKLKNLSLWAI